jgi:hypothetical protein
VGQANHYLVTLELGLESLAAFGKPPNSYFAPMWNPKNEKSSILRSEDYLLGAAMAWAVDCVDGYIGELARSHSLIHPRLRSDILLNDRSVQKEVDVITKHFSLDTCYLAAMVHLLIQWRNNLTHARAENSLRPEMRQSLVDSAKLIVRRHRKLDIQVMLDKFDATAYPQFKEVASLLKATHDLVGIIDRQIRKKIHLRRFVIARSKEYFRDQKKIQRLGNVFSANQQRKQNYVAQIFQEFGLVATKLRPKMPDTAILPYEEIVELLPDFDAAKLYFQR